MRPSGFLTALAAATAITTAACEDPFAIKASIENKVDTLELFAVNGTPIDKPSAYILTSRLRTSPGFNSPAYNFDFLYRIDPTAGSQLVPFGALAPGDSVAGRPGFRATDLHFDDITVAEQVGYQTSQPEAIAVGSTFYVRGAIHSDQCFLGVPTYAKLEVLSLDAGARTVRFRILVDQNCGYRGLEPGIPKL